MENIYNSKATYFSGGGKHKWNDEYDYMLVRQDYNGFESVYFNLDEIKKVIDMIYNGKILIHMNYSILYTKTEELITEADRSGFNFCYMTVHKDTVDK